MTATLSIDDRYKMLITPIYTLAEGSRLIGIHSTRIRRWFRGYNYEYRVGDQIKLIKQRPVVINSGIPIISFLDLIDLLFVKKFLDLNFSLQYIRKAFDEARKILKTDHLAQEGFYTLGRKIVLDLKRDSKYMLVLMHGNQYSFPEIIKQISERIDFEHVTGKGYAIRWYPNGKENFVVVDPSISFGRPTLIGRGIAIENIYDLYLGEKQQIEPVSQWFGIPQSELIPAIKFQSSLVGV